MLRDVSLSVYVVQAVELAEYGRRIEWDTIARAWHLDRAIFLIGVIAICKSFVVIALHICRFTLLVNCIKQLKLFKPQPWLVYQFDIYEKKKTPIGLV